MSAIAIASGGSALTPATGNITLFVSNLGSDSNPGTALLPFRTIQHAINVAFSFSYATLYQCTIKVAAGTYTELLVIPDDLFLSSHVRQFPSGFLIGDQTTPTNVVITPPVGTSNNIVSFSTGWWAIDGFSIKADTTSSRGNMLGIFNSYVSIGALDFNTNTGANCAALIAVNGGGFLIGYANAVSNTITVQGDGAQVGQIIDAVDFSFLDFADFPFIIKFNSAINLNGANFLTVFNSCYVDLRFITLVNPGSITGGQVALLQGATTLLVGADPSIITWPSGPFSNSVISATTTIDGLPYFQPSAGALVDQSTIYRGSWQIHKDSNQTTGAGLSLAIDDGGIIQVKQIGRVPNTQTGTPYVLALSDQDGRVEMSNAGANQLTVPANATVAFPIGTEIRVVQVGAGATTIAGAVGVTVDAAGVVGGQWKSVMLYKRGTNEWVQTNV